MTKQEELPLRSLHLFQGERSLVITGLIGFILALFCGVWAKMHGGAVPPEGNVLRAFSFNAALGMFLISTASILPLAGMGPKARSIFRWTYILLSLIAYGIETMQHFRGINPRFTNSEAPLDILLGAIFGLDAIGLILFYVIFGVYFFLKNQTNRPVMVTGIRYAMIAVFISFIAGLWIISLQSRFTGEHGNIIWLHGMGFHALQALPFTAWFTERSSFNSAVQRLSIHVSGAAYLLGLIALSVQTYLGERLFQWSIVSLVGVSSFTIVMALSIAAILLSKKGLSQSLKA
jgi:hypothetical protein